MPCLLPCRPRWSPLGLAPCIASCPSRPLVQRAPASSCLVIPPSRWRSPTFALSFLSSPLTGGGYANCEGLQLLTACRAGRVATGGQREGSRAEQASIQHSNGPRLASSCRWLRRRQQRRDRQPPAGAELAPEPWSACRQDRVRAADVPGWMAGRRAERAAGHGPASGRTRAARSLPRACLEGLGSSQAGVHADQRGGLYRQRDAVRQRVPVPVLREQRQAQHRGAPAGGAGGAGRSHRVTAPPESAAAPKAASEALLPRPGRHLPAARPAASPPSLNTPDHT